MKQNSYLAAALALAVAPFAISVAQAEDVAALNTPGWYFSVDALALQRSKPGGGTLVAANPTGTPFLTAGELDFGIGAGVDATIGYNGLAIGPVEVRLMYSKMDGTNTFVSPGGFIGLGFTGPGGTTFASEFDTTFASGEVNWRHGYNERLSVLAGLRAMDISDNLRAVLDNEVTGLYEAENTLLGAQIGAEMALNPASSPFQLSLSGKLGAFANRSNAGSQAFLGNTSFGEFQSEHVTETSYAIELGLKAEYRLSKTTVLTGGYQMLWANNIALATNAASNGLTNPSLLRDNVYRDDLVLQAVTLGVKMSF